MINESARQRLRSHQPGVDDDGWVTSTRHYGATRQLSAATIYWLKPCGAYCMYDMKRWIYGRIDLIFRRRRRKQLFYSLIPTTIELTRVL